MDSPNSVEHTERRRSLVKRRDSSKPSAEDKAHVDMQAVQGGSRTFRDLWVDIKFCAYELHK